MHFFNYIILSYLLTWTVKTHTRHKPHFPITSGVKVIVHWPLTLTSLLTTTKISLTLGSATAEDKRPLKKKKSKTRWIWRTSRVWNRFHKSTLYCEGYTQTKKKKVAFALTDGDSDGIWHLAGHTHRWWTPSDFTSSLRRVRFGAEACNLCRVLWKCKFRVKRGEDESRGEDETVPAAD